MDFDRKFYISYVVILCMQNVKFDKGKKIHTNLLIEFWMHSQGTGGRTGQIIPKKRILQLNK